MQNCWSTIQAVGFLTIPVFPSIQDYEVRIWYSAEPGDECYVAQVLEMPGIMAHGETREEAAREIQVALAAALEIYREDGEVPPAPRHHGAVSLGRLGGLVRTRRKRLAARRNGAKGGRPRKTVGGSLAGVYRG